MVCQALQALVYPSQQRLWPCVDAALRHDRGCGMAHVYARSTWRAASCVDQRVSAKLCLVTDFLQIAPSTRRIVCNSSPARHDHRIHRTVMAARCRVRIAVCAIRGMGFFCGNTQCRDLASEQLNRNAIVGERIVPGRTSASVSSLSQRNKSSCSTSEMGHEPHSSGC